MADIKFDLESLSIRHDSPARGRISVSYPGRYDGVVINTQVLDSNHHVTYTSSNGKPLSNVLARLFIPRSEMSDNQAVFTAQMNFKPDRDYEIKFRASIIEQHKEIESVVVFASYSTA